MQNKLVITNQPVKNFTPAPLSSHVYCSLRRWEPPWYHQRLEHHAADGNNEDARPFAAHDSPAPGMPQRLRRMDAEDVQEKFQDIR